MMTYSYDAASMADEGGALSPGLAFTLLYSKCYSYTNREKPINKREGDKYAEANGERDWCVALLSYIRTFFFNSVSSSNSCALFFIIVVIIVEVIRTVQTTSLPDAIFVWFIVIFVWFIVIFVWFRYVCV
eukprot:gene11405-7910_t